jgi:DNA-binding XRE family transcriptional regulator
MTLRTRCTRRWGTSRDTINDVLPIEMANRIFSGENPIIVWCDHRGMTRNQLVEKTGISIHSMLKIESGAEYPSWEALNAIATVLMVDIDDILWVPGVGGSKRPK